MQNWRDVYNNQFNDKKPDVVVIAAAKVGGILANSSYPTEFLLNNMKIPIVEAMRITPDSFFTFLAKLLISNYGSS